MTVTCWRAGALGLLVFTLGVTAGCRRKGAAKTAAPLEYREAKDPAEQRSVEAVCQAAAEVADTPGIEDRMGRIMELAAATVPSPEFLEGLAAMGGRERHQLMQKLVTKYGLDATCQKGLAGFDRRDGPEEPPPPASDSPAK